MKVYLDAYLAKNLGDDLFIDILLNRYKKHKFYNVSRWENGYNYSNLKIYGKGFTGRVYKKLGLEKCMANRCEIVATVGGSMYMEGENSNVDYSLGNKKRYILGINFGPYKTDTYLKNVTGLFKNSEDVCFREKYSYNLFKDLNNTRMAPDIVFGMNTSNVNITNNKRVIISVVLYGEKSDKNFERKYENKIIEMMKYFVEKGYEVTLMSFCRLEGDEIAIQNILNKCDSHLKQKVDSYFYRGNIKEALDVLGNSQIIVGTRLHSNIIGMVLGKTVIPIIYSDKTKNILEDMNFQGSIVDLKQNDEIDLNTIDLEYKLDISYQRENSKKHFEKLDKILL